MAVCNNLDCSQAPIFSQDRQDQALAGTDGRLGFICTYRASSGFKAVHREGLTSSTARPFHSKPVSAFEATVTKGL